MGLFDKLAHLKLYKRGVSHSTFNPGGPGVVRIHLIPPKFRPFGNSSYVVILNGYYVLPIGRTWALILAKFIDESNAFDGKELGSNDEVGIVRRTLKYARKLFPFVAAEEVERDLYSILEIIFAVARGEGRLGEVERLSIRSYAKNMSAPHRMDLMVSAMTDANGAWKCNQKCAFCYAAGQKMSSATELETSEWYKIIEKLWDARIPMLTFTGGEPTLREDLPSLVKRAEKFVTRVNTNGINVTPELAAELAEAGLDSMQITLYSHDEDIHNTLVGAKRFSDTVSGIKNALSAGLDVSVNTPICRLNRDYAETLRFIRSLGVRFVTVSGLILTGSAALGQEERELSQEELTEAVISAKLKADEYGMELDFTSPGLIPSAVLEEHGMNVPMCGACISNMAIAPDGRVVPCQSWLGEGSSLGNILSDSFDKIWNCPRAKELRSMSAEESLCCPFRAERSKKNA